MQEFVNMPLSEHNSGAGEGDRRSAGSPESSLVGLLPALFADLRKLDSCARGCMNRAPLAGWCCRPVVFCQLALQH